MKEHSFVYLHDAYVEKGRGGGGGIEQQRFHAGTSRVTSTLM